MKLKNTLQSVKCRIVLVSLVLVMGMKVRSDELVTWGGVANSLVVAVASGEKALSAEQIALITSGNCAQLVKTGEGTLYNTNAALASFTGDIIVDKGTMIIDRTGDLGTTAGKTVVSNGASLYINAASTDQNLNKFLSEKFYISGTGASENFGALRVKKVTGANTSFIDNLTLNGDTLLVCETRYDFGGTIDLGGYKLTKKGSGRFTINSTIQNPGHLEIASGECQFDGNKNYNGDASNTLTIGSKVTMHSWDFQSMPAWTLIMEEGASRNAYNNANSVGKANYNKWNGPVVLNGKVTFGSAGTDQVLSIVGNISGPGSLYLGNGSQDFVMNLHGENTYEGGTFVNGAVDLKLHSAKAVSCVKPLVMTDVTSVDASGVALDEKVKFPDVEWRTTADAQLSCFAAEMKSLVKTGEGTLTIPQTTFEGALDVREGRVLLPYGTPGYRAGVKEGGEGVTKADLLNPGDDVLTTVALGPEAAYQNGSTFFPVNTPRTWYYAGYIWNRSGVDQTWSFAESFDEWVILKLDGKEILRNEVYDTPTFKNIVVTPGAHKFEIILCNANGGGGPNDKNDWGRNDFGVAYDPTGACGTVASMYSSLSDAGDGALVTQTNEGTREVSFTNIAELKLSGTGSVDLRGNAYSFEKVFASGGEVTNGHVTISQTLTVAPLSGCFKVMDGDVQFAEGAMLVLDDEGLDKKTVYTAIQADEISGVKPTLVASDGWRLRQSGSGTFEVYYQKGLVIIVR